MLTTTDQIKQDAELCLQWAHELDTQYGDDESERCATADCLDMSLMSLRDAITDNTLYYVLPVLREAENEWLSQNDTLPRGGFGKILMYEDWQGIYQFFETCEEWKYAIAVEATPQAIRDAVTSLGLRVRHNNVQLDHLHRLIDAMTGRELGHRDPEPAATNTDRAHVAAIDWREAGF